MNLRHAFVGATLLAGVCAAALPAFAGGLWSTLPAPVIPMSGNEVLPCDTELANGANPQTEGCTANNLTAYANGTPQIRNIIIGGDATTNLFQRGTTGASQTTTVAYGGPDRWAYWSGTSTAMTVSQDSTAADLPTSYKYAFKMARTSGQTGVVQVCMAQEVESANSYQFAGTTAELDFHAATGANYSAASANMTAYIIYGTGTDEGTSKLAFGLNAGGGGSTAWAGQANATAAVISLGAVSTVGRYAAIANIPATATELAVALCYTPVGTAGTNDYIAFSGIQLVRNNANAAYASATVGVNSNTVQLASFDRRPQGFETLLQERYTYSINEGTITAGSAMAPAGIAVTTATCLADIPFPVTMRAAPTYTNALTATTFKVNSAALNTALSTPFSVTTGVNTVNGGSVTFTGTGLAGTAGFACILVSAAGSGQMLFSAEL